MIPFYICSVNLFKYIPNWLKNKYIVVTAVFLVFMLFLDNRNVFNQYNRYKELKNLERTHRDLTLTNRRLERDNRELQVNAAEIERIAREKYHMKRPNETVFLFTNASKPGN